MHNLRADAALANLAPLAKLQSLSLADTPVTDAGLEQLHGLKELKELDLSFTQTSEEGQAKLQKALPELKITH